MRAFFQPIGICQDLYYKNNELINIFIFRPISSIQTKIKLYLKAFNVAIYLTAFSMAIWNTFAAIFCILHMSIAPKKCNQIKASRNKSQLLCTPLAMKEVFVKCAINYGLE